MEIRLEPAVTDTYSRGYDIATDGKGDVLIWNDTQTEMQQCATLAAHTEVYAIPLLPNVGNDWQGFLTRQKTVTELDAEIRQNIQVFTDNGAFLPYYTRKDGTLNVTVQPIQLALNE